MAGPTSSGGLVIVGACHAGVQIAASARENGYQEPIFLIGEEKALPYQRPPLSKAFLLGKTPEEALALRAETFYESHGIELLLGERAQKLDRRAKRLELKSGRVLEYGKLALASGARVRLLPLPGAELKGVLYLRDLADSKTLKERAESAQSVAVIGGGFIGLEIAASMKSLGKEVTVIEAADRLMARAVGQEVSAFYAAQHRARGVDVKLSCSVEKLEGNAKGAVSAVVTAEGRVAADLVVVGIGVQPNVELAAEAGVDCPNGIAVDVFARTHDADILAAGDCAFHPNTWANGGEGGMVRLESVQNAADQARTAGAMIAGEEKPYESAPWFWTDQFDIKMQMVGLSQCHDRTVLRGAPEEGKFSVFYFRGKRLLAIDSINRPADHIAGRKLLSARLSPTFEQAADEALPLKSLLD
jgi:3-phenylpropionate/trans-cinnamate dioxygenase ferredoxin reductase subunit